MGVFAEKLSPGAGQSRIHSFDPLKAAETITKWRDYAASDRL